jgi:APA family basic amino acid/polyamine antiporter
VASLGALLALIAGIGRTTFAMAREQDLPPFLAAVHPRWKVPHRAEVVVALVVIAIVAFADIRGAIGFSSFGVLLYYLVANLAAFRQRPEARRYPRALQAVGAAGCIILAVTLPWQSVVAGAAVVLVGVAYRAVRLMLTRAA